MTIGKYLVLLYILNDFLKMVVINCRQCWKFGHIGDIFSINFGKIIHFMLIFVHDFSRLTAAKSKTFIAEIVSNLFMSEVMTGILGLHESI